MKRSRDYSDTNRTEVTSNVRLFKEKFYTKWLSCLTNPTAIKLRDNVLRYDASNSFGLPIEKKVGLKSFLHWLICEKNKHPTSVLIVQVGEFFELVGIDAILSIEYGGLRAMGTIPVMKTGTPIASVQRLLDSLIHQGLTCIVYEESNDGVLIGNHKQRHIVQVVCRSSPLYFRAVQCIEEDDPRNYPPLIIVIPKYCFVLDLNNYTYSVLTDTSNIGISTIITTLRPGEVLYGEGLNAIHGDHICTRIPEDIRTERAVFDYVRNMYCTGDTVFSRCCASRYQYVISKTTSDALGITSNNENIPNTVTAALGRVSSMERRFFLSWLLIRPPPEGRISMEILCSSVSDGTIILNKQHLLNPTKVIGLLLSGGVCKDLKLLHTIHDRLFHTTSNKHVHTIACIYMGIEQDFLPYTEELEYIRILLENVIVEHTHQEGDIPIDFINRNYTYVVRNKLQEKVECAKNHLECIIHKLKSKFGLKLVYHGSNDNDIVIVSKQKPSIPDAIQVDNQHKANRRNAWSSVELRQAVIDFLRLTTESHREQCNIIRETCHHITTHYCNTLRVFLQSEVIKKCIHSHLAVVIKRGWNPACIERGDGDIDIRACFPYWMSAGSSVVNDVCIRRSNVVVLTAANGNGKTTVLRTIVLISLLAYAGFYTPCAFSKIPTISNCLLKIPMGDKPSVALSSFESEILDLKCFLEVVDEHSLVCLDEFARSTNPEEGAIIAQSVVDFLIHKKCFVIFSTHFLKMVGKFKRTYTSNVTYTTIDGTHEYKEGCITSSMALMTCRKFGIPNSIINRATDLMKNDNLHFHYKHHSVTKTIEKIATDITGKSPVLVNENTLIPPLYTSSPCVYIINEQDGVWYCGETQNVIHRRQQHQNNKRSGNIMIFPVSNKSEARLFETKIQLACIKNGIRLTSISDSKNSI